MDDLISRTAAIDEIEEYLEEYAELDPKGYHSLKWCAMMEAKDVLIKLPTVEPRRGRWIDMGDFEQCSVCTGTHLKEFKSYYGIATWVKTPYCPFCGAKMEGDETDES